MLVQLKKTICIRLGSTNIYYYFFFLIHYNFQLLLYCKNCHHQQAIIAYEEKEATSRSPEQDSTNFFSTCQSIRDAMSKIAKLKTTNESSVSI